MLKKIKILAFFLLSIGLISSFDVLANDDVSVFINKSEVISDVSASIINGRTIIPVRAISENLCLDVKWDAEEKKITLSGEDITAVMQVDNALATVYKDKKEEKVTLDAPPVIINGRTLAPVRFVSELFGADVLWNGEAREVNINYDIQLKIKDRYITLGDSKYFLPKADREETSIRALEWYVYNKDYSVFRMVAVKDGKVVGFFTNAKDFNTTIGVSYGNKAKEVSIPGLSVKVYEDTIKGNVGGVLVIKEDAFGTADITTDIFLRAQAQELFDMVNCFRVSNGLESLKWDGPAAVSSRAHSNDMAQNNYFDHTGKDGSSPSDRFSKYSTENWTSVGENIYAGSPYACEAFFALSNSMGHRGNMLNPVYKCSGVGEGYSKDSYYGYYFTQLFASH